MRLMKKDLIVTYISTMEWRTFSSKKGGFSSFSNNITRERNYLLGNYRKNTVDS